MEEQAGAICLPGMAGQVEKMRRVSDNTVVPESFFWNLKEYSENAFFALHQGSVTGNPSMISSYPLPDETDTVVEIFLKDEDDEGK